MKFCWSTINVADMEASLSFYQEIVGLPIVRRFKSGPDMEIAFLGVGETQVELICHAGGGAAVIGPDISLGFTVSSVEEKMAFVRSKGLAVHSGPFQPNPHVAFFYVLDPNGLKIQFVENR